MSAGLEPPRRGPGFRGRWAWWHVFYDTPSPPFPIAGSLHETDSSANFREKLLGHPPLGSSPQPPPLLSATMLQVNVFYQLPPYTNDKTRARDDFSCLESRIQKVPNKCVRGPRIEVLLE